MKEFVTAVAANEEQAEGTGEGWVTFKVDGVECRAKRPTAGQVAYLTSAMHKRAPLEQQIAGAINFCMAIMESDTAAFLSDKLLDAEDPFDLPNIQDIVEYLIEVWSGRPTEPSSDSSKSEDTTGSTSTPSTPETATLSTSGSTAS